MYYRLCYCRPWNDSTGKWATIWGLSIVSKINFEWRRHKICLINPKNPAQTAEHSAEDWLVQYFCWSSIRYAHTDDSTICVDFHTGLIWRKYGCYLPEAFYDKTKRPVSVMVWGGIEPLGYSAHLLKCANTVNLKSYVTMLSQNHISEQIGHFFGENFIWQQDNAKPIQMFPRRINWPANSPDLSPI